MRPSPVLEKLDHVLHQSHEYDDQPDQYEDNGNNRQYNGNRYRRHWRLPRTQIGNGKYHNCYQRRPDSPTCK